MSFYNLFTSSVLILGSFLFSRHVYSPYPTLIPLYVMLKAVILILMFSPLFLLKSIRLLLIASSSVAILFLCLDCYAQLRIRGVLYKVFLSLCSLKHLIDYQKPIDAALESTMALLRSFAFWYNFEDHKRRILYLRDCYEAGLSISDSLGFLILIVEDGYFIFNKKTYKFRRRALILLAFFFSLRVWSGLSSRVITLPSLFAENKVVQLRL